MPIKDGRFSGEGATRDAEALADQGNSWAMPGNGPRNSDVAREAARARRRAHTQPEREATEAPLDLFEGSPLFQEPRPEDSATREGDDGRVDRSTLPAVQAELVAARSHIEAATALLAVAAKASSGDTAKAATAVETHLLAARQGLQQAWEPLAALAISGAFTEDLAALEELGSSVDVVGDAMEEMVRTWDSVPLGNVKLHTRGYIEGCANWLNQVRTGLGLPSFDVDAQLLKVEDTAEHTDEERTLDVDAIALEPIAEDRLTPQYVANKLLDNIAAVLINLHAAIDNFEGIVNLPEIEKSGGMNAIEAFVKMHQFVLTELLNPGGAAGLPVKIVDKIVGILSDGENINKVLHVERKTKITEYVNDLRTAITEQHTSLLGNRADIRADIVKGYADAHPTSKALYLEALHAEAIRLERARTGHLSVNGLVLEVSRHWIQHTDAPGTRGGGSRVEITLDGEWQQLGAARLYAPEGAKILSQLKRIGHDVEDPQVLRAPIRIIWKPLLPKHDDGVSGLQEIQVTCDPLTLELDWSTATISVPSKARHSRDWPAQLEQFVAKHGIPRLAGLTGENA